ncbi:unnamed protein product [Vicia faba]|uniref:Uncharacterized protein n=1 Tax=Vicia faba TaxID=3906 RepID=A0AAV0YFA7_VICFA|nr:unnamed protein product [Vicia faba]
MGPLSNHKILCGSHPELHIPGFPRQQLVSGLQVNLWGNAYQQRQKKLEKHVNEIPMPNIQLLSRLLEIQLVKLYSLDPLPTNLSPDFDVNARFVSHPWAPGYDIEDRKRLKYKDWHLSDFFSKDQSLFGKLF